MSRTITPPPGAEDSWQLVRTATFRQQRQPDPPTVWSPEGACGHRRHTPPAAPQSFDLRRRLARSPTPPPRRRHRTPTPPRRRSTHRRAFTEEEHDEFKRQEKVSIKAAIRRNRRRAKTGLPLLAHDEPRRIRGYVPPNTAEVAPASPHTPDEQREWNRPFSPRAPVIVAPGDLQWVRYFHIDYWSQYPREIQRLYLGYTSEDQDKLI